MTLSFPLALGGRARRDTSPTPVDGEAPSDRTWVVHLDQPELHRRLGAVFDPSLEGVPFVLLRRDDEAACDRVGVSSRDARRRGVRAGMPLDEAKRRCRGLRVADDTPGPRVDPMRALTSMLAAFSPALEPRGRAGLTLVLHGVFGASTASRVAHRLRILVESRLGGGLRIGVGPTRTIARLAAREARPGEIHELTATAFRERFGPRPVTCLDGVDERMAARLREVGVRTVGELARVDRERLAHGLGVFAAPLHEMATGGLPDPDAGRAPGREPGRACA